MTRILTSARPQLHILPWLGVISSLLVFLYALRFAIWYADQAWFFQDDFLFLLDYASQIQTTQLISVDNFGRFVSRNAYWWGMHQVFGLNAASYFYVNLACLIASSCLLFVLLRPLSWKIALFAGLAYLTAPGTLANYSWISNSQHLLAHLFLLAYLSLTSWAWRQGRVDALWAAVPVFAMALSANLLSSAALSLPALCWLNAAAGKQRNALLGNLFLCAGLSLLFVWVLRSAQTGPYATAFRWEVFAANLHFYYGSPAVFLGLLAILGWGAASLWREGQWLGTWLMLSGAVFLVPFLPLVHQHYINYAVLSHVGVLAGSALLVSRSRSVAGRCAAWALLLVLAFCFVKSSRDQLHYFEHTQRGHEQRAWVETLKSELRREPASNGDVICFSDSVEPHHPGSALPPFWWQIGFGRAFSVFVDPRYTYALAEPAVACTRHVWVQSTGIFLLPSTSTLH